MHETGRSPRVARLLLAMAPQRILLLPILLPPVEVSQRVVDVTANDILHAGVLL
jgi:hypothetical protein